MGAKGHSQVDRILLGSTSDYVATHAHCSVLVVRQARFGRRGQRASRRGCLRRLGSSPICGRRVAQFDWGANTEISVVGVAGYSPIFDPEYGFNPKSIRNEAQDALRQASQRLQSRVHHVDSRLIEYDHVAEGLVRFTEDEQVDFIVIGDTGTFDTRAAHCWGAFHDSSCVTRSAVCGSRAIAARIDSSGKTSDQDRQFGESDLNHA